MNVLNETEVVVRDVPVGVPILILIFYNITVFYDAIRHTHFQKNHDELDFDG